MIAARCHVEEILELRHLVLRKGRPFEDVHFSGDELDSTLHFCVKSETGLVVGCASFMDSVFEEKSVMQLRGMAVHPSKRGSGAATLLLEFAEDFFRERGDSTLWCNARVEAINFYKNHGWKQISEPFWVSGIGPHVKMVKELILE